MGNAPVGRELVRPQCNCPALGRMPFDRPSPLLVMDRELLREFYIANCLIKADRTHNDGNQSHERPSPRRASGDHTSDNPYAKGTDTYGD